MSENKLILEKAYEAGNYENKIYQQWEETGCFKGVVDPNKKPFSISMPPPNATGTLHLGHAVMLALQDIMIRHKRMSGYSTLWLPGTDHAAIATQSVVEKKLQSEGIANPRVELGREKLLAAIREFADNSKSTIRNQVRKMGSSCDWESEKYTLDEDLNKSVNTFFGRMYSDGLIYHGDRIVNWDPKMQTTVADDELERKEETAPFYTFQYGPFEIGTARPETKFGDKYVVMHPDDQRYKDYQHGEQFECEWINGPITATIIKDSAVDPEFGTGVMTITPWHDTTDFEIAQRHNLEFEQVIDFSGNLLPIAEEFAGMHISKARKLIVEKLDSKGLLVKTDLEYIHNLAVNYRGKGTVEPQIMKQWFIDVNKKAIDWKGEKASIKEVMQDTVNSGMIKIIPARFEKTYFHWINNLRDWCISRQIWWGHQIPVWFKVSPEDKSKWEQHPESSSFLLQALNIKIEKTIFSEEKPTEAGEWIRDPDTLDTWFSSALWTFSTLGWPEHTEKLKYFHPTSVLETGYDIIFFWVARMILASTYCLRSDNFSEAESIPFKEVYLHGLIKDREGKKMSKSRPETCIDPLKMIEKYGTDAVRLSLIVGNTPGNDMRLYEEKISGYRNFVNKIWNSARFALMNVEPQDFSEELQITAVKSLADKWILTKLNELIENVNSDLQKYHFSEAANNIYNFTWGTYCDWYLEISKGDQKNPGVLIYVLKTILKLLHPFTPFVTEVLWSHLDQDQLLINSSWPEVRSEFSFPQASDQLETIKSIITAIRKTRAEYKVEPVKKIEAIINGHQFTDLIKSEEEIIKRLARLENLVTQESSASVENSATTVINGIEIILPLAGMVDAEQEAKRLTKEIEKLQNFITKMESKLNNDNFVAKAPPQVIEREKDRLAQETINIQKLKKQLESL